MKPKNFPARKATRKGASQEEIALARAIRSKKTPKETWSQDRSLRRGGKLGR